MCSDVVIRAEGLTKSYRVFNQSADRLKQAVTFGRRQYYKRFTALDNVSFEIRKGETVGIVGRNGSGKSTLLQLVCGILKPSAGRVEVTGRISALLELGAGFHPDFTGHENVLFYATVLGMPRDQIEGRLPEIEAFADIGEFMDQPVRTYSSGMFVRLAFATAIHTDPDILVVDEALSVGDALFQKKCNERVQALRSIGVTILLVSHDFNLVTNTCDRVLLLDQSRLLRDGPAAEVINAYRETLAKAMSSISPRKNHERVSTNSSPELFLRLWPSAPELKPASTRYGDGRAEILEAAIFDHENQPISTVVRGNEFLIRLHVLHHVDLDYPSASFAIKDSRGVVLCGTHVHYQDDPPGPQRSGSRCVVEFRQTMILNPGEYVISVGYQNVEHGEAQLCDVRLDVMTIAVVGAEQRSGVFDPQSRIRWAAVGHCSESPQR